MFQLTTRLALIKSAAKRGCCCQQLLFQNKILMTQGKRNDVLRFFYEPYPSFSSIVSSSSTQTSLSSMTSLWDEMDEKTRKLARDILSIDQQQQHKQEETKLDETETLSKLLLRRRIALSKAITLLESKSHHSYKQRQSDLLLSYLLQNMPSSKGSNDQESNNFRIGLAGPPGAGKSSLIEALGMYILDDLPKKPNEGDNDAANSHYCPTQLAVVCVDPSSSVSGGSILGDKTRMTQLSRHERAYIRPSANSGVVGGLAAYTDDVVTCCHAAGYSLVLVETVGLGQSEIEVAQSVDMVLLLLPPGGGDDLQGVKKGIVEIADLMVVTKADGHLLPAARQTAADYRGALRLLQDIGSSSGSSGSRGRKSDFAIDKSGSGDCDEENAHTSSLSVWKPPVILTSVATGEGLDKLWEQICAYRHHVLHTGILEERRQDQATYWMWKHLSQLVHDYIHNKDSTIQEQAHRLERSLAQRQLTPRVAAAQLLHQLLLRSNPTERK